MKTNKALAILFIFVIGCTCIAYNIYSNPVNQLPKSIKVKQ